MKLRKLYLLAFLSIGACDEVIELDLKQAPPVIVIEGQFTDREGKNYVRISRSIGFYEQGPPPAIINAEVTIEGSDGTELTFLPYAGNEPDSLGLYFPEVDIKGNIGVTYTLKVTIDGNYFEASDTMVPVTSIDSLKSIIDPFEQNTPDEEGRYYQVLVFTKEPQDTKDFYRFRFYRNWQQENLFDSDIYLADDLVLGENISGVPVPFYYAQKDTSVVEMYGISKRAYLYFTDLQTVLNSDGGMFSPPPANPRTNLTGGALGFFTVASVESDTLVVK